MDENQLKSRPKKLKTDDTPSTSQSTDVTAPEPISSLFILNDDCIRAIFEKLHMDDVCSMSFTCSRLNELAHGYYQQKYSSKDRLTVAMRLKDSPWSYGGEVVAEEIYDSKYTKFFETIRNVHIKSENITLAQIFHYVRSKRWSFLKRLELDFSGALGIFPNEVYTDELECVQSVSLQNHGGVDIHYSLLKHCPNLQHLGVSTQTEGDINWLRQDYPNLKSLSICLEDSRHRSVFDIMCGPFFRRNSQLKAVKCSNMLNMLALIRSDIKIDRWTLGFQLFGNFTNIFDELKVYFGRNPGSYLVIHMKRWVFNTFGLLANFNEMAPISELRVDSIFETVLHLTAEPLSRLTNLVKLSIGFDFTVREKAWKLCTVMEHLSKNLVNLQELELTTSSLGVEYQEFLKLAKPIVRNAAKLKKFTITSAVTGCPFCFHEDDLIILNKDRLANQNASPIQIVIDFRCSIPNNFPKFIIPSNGILKLKVLRHGRLAT